MNDRFFEAWITRTWRVCGRKLQPLCLGHLVNLAAVSSPLLPYAEIDESTPVTVGDLLVAVRICSEGFPFRCQLKPRLIDVFWKWLLARSPKLFLHHARLFAAYRHDHCSSPEFWIDTEAQNSSRSISAPIALSKAAFLISNSSLAEERVWSMPLGRVDFLIAAIEERKTGSVRFFDERCLLYTSPSPRD